MAGGGIRDGENEWRLRHMADIQTTIGRLSQNSFVIRGWSVTLVSVMFAIIASQGRGSWPLVFAALGPTFIFWVLDAYYLRRERLFRHLYQVVARRLTQGADAPDITAFDMDVRQYEREVGRLSRVMFTGHVLAVPSVLSALLLLFVFATA